MTTKDPKIDGGTPPVINVAGDWWYHHDRGASRRLRLERNHTISEGRGVLEQEWRTSHDTDGPLLEFFGEGQVRIRMRKDEDGWRGKWLGDDERECWLTRFNAAATGGRVLVITQHQGLSEALSLTAAVRDLKRAAPRLEIWVDTNHRDLWRHNPHVNVGCPNLVGRRGSVRYNLAEAASSANIQKIDACAEFLMEKLGIRFAISKLAPDVYLDDVERSLAPIAGFDVAQHYWLINADVKEDHTLKLWPPEHWQRIVDYLNGRGVKVVQMGHGAWRPNLNGVVNMADKTGLRDVLRLVYHASGVVTHLSFPMHLAAAFDKPCVVPAGGIISPYRGQYMTQRYLHTIGGLDCCRNQACGKQRAWTPQGSTHSKPDCLWIVSAGQDTKVGRCMQMIQPDRVIEAIENYYDDGSIAQMASAKAARAKTGGCQLTHGLGDCVQLLRMITAARSIGAAIPPFKYASNKKYLFETCGIAYCRDAAYVIGYPYDANFNHPDPANDQKANKLGADIEHMPFLDIDPKLVWEKTCQNDDLSPLVDLSGDNPWFDRLESLPPVKVVFHPHGVSFSAQKNLADNLIEEIQWRLVGKGYGVILLNWDDPKLKAINHPAVLKVDNWKWRDENRIRETLQLYAVCDLMIGVDSGPLHLCAFSRIQALGIFTEFHPSAVCLPRQKTVHMCRRKCSQWDQSINRAMLDRGWNIVDYEGSYPTGDAIVSQVVQMVPARRCSRFYAQHGEDEWMSQHWEQLQLPETGVFVEVGVGREEWGSNTLWLEERGWSGLLIEPDPRNIPTIKYRRSSSLVVEAACVAPGQEGMREFRLHPDSTLSGFLRQDGQPIRVSAATLDQILSNPAVSGKIARIDVLSIDTEGTELEVWAGFSPKRYRPKVVIIEYNTDGLPDRSKSIVEMLARDGYERTHKTDGNLIFTLSRRMTVV